MNWIPFYYNSLPDLPHECPLFSRNIMHRDFFKCNPTNTGHYKYPRFETLSYDEGCHKREVQRFLRRPDPEKYVVFYTWHTDAQGESMNKVIGYFKVGEHKRKPVGFFASDLVLLSKDSVIPIRYIGRGVPTSWGRSKVKPFVDRILQDLISSASKDISAQYQNETQEIMAMLQSEAGRRRMLETCEGCNYRPSCCWGKKSVSKRKEVLDKLYRRGRPC